MRKLLSALARDGVAELRHARPFDFEREVGRARRAALQVLLNNARRGRGGIPRAAAWGSKEPYTRDLMIGSLGVLASGNEELANSLKGTLISLAHHQRPDGAMPRICDESEDYRAGDTTPLFLIGLAAYRQIARAPVFLSEAAERALLFCDSQCPADNGLGPRQPEGDMSDARHMLGHELLVDALFYSALMLFGRGEQAEVLREKINRATGQSDPVGQADESLAILSESDSTLLGKSREPGERFDLLGNSIAILAGALSLKKSIDIIHWLELTCEEMRDLGQLTTRCPPNLVPPHNSNDSVFRVTTQNHPREYQGGEVWPFVSGFYIAALVCAGQMELAEEQLLALTDLCAKKKDDDLEFGFNEWIRASDGRACGEDWQNWSASMYLYAAACVESGRTPLFELVRARAQTQIP